MVRANVATVPDLTSLQVPARMHACMHALTCPLSRPVLPWRPARLGSCTPSKGAEHQHLPCVIQACVLSRSIHQPMYAHVCRQAWRTHTAYFTSQASRAQLLHSADGACMHACMALCSTVAWMLLRVLQVVRLDQFRSMEGLSRVLQCTLSQLPHLQALHIHTLLTFVTPLWQAGVPLLHGFTGLKVLRRAGTPPPPPPPPTCSGNTG